MNNMQSLAIISFPVPNMDLVLRPVIMRVWFQDWTTIVASCPHSGLAFKCVKRGRLVLPRCWRAFQAHNCVQWGRPRYRPVDKGFDQGILWSCRCNMQPHICGCMLQVNPFNSCIIFPYSNWSPGLHEDGSFVEGDGGINLQVLG